MTGLSRETEEVLRRARLSEAMPVSRRRRIKGAVLARLAAGGVALTATEAAGAGFWASSVGAAVKGVASLALVASLGAGGYMAVRPAKTSSAVLSAPKAIHREPAPPAPVAQVLRSPAEPHVASVESRSDRAIIVKAQPVRAKVSGRSFDVATKSKRAELSAAPPSALANAPVPVVTASVVSAPTVVVPPAEPPAVSTLAEEARLLREADRALRAGKPEVAIAVLDDCAARYPDGVLAPERAGERLVAMCQLGKADAASSARFLAGHTGSTLSARVRQACGAR